MSQQIENLAASMGVSTADVACLTQSIANSISADKIAGVFTESSEKTQVELVQAYAIEANRKMESFSSRYLTNPDAQEGFRQSVRASLAA